MKTATYPPESPDEWKFCSWCGKEMMWVPSIHDRRTGAVLLAWRCAEIDYPHDEPDGPGFQRPFGALEAVMRD